MAPDARRLIALTHGSRDPASRFRVLQYLPHLAARGWQVTHAPNRPERPELRRRGPLLGRLDGWRRRLGRRADIRAAAAHDLAWVNRDLLAGDPAWERRLARAGRPVVFDFDDAIYLTDRRGHFPRALEAATWVLAGNATLAAEARRHSDRVSVLPTSIEVGRYQVTRHDERPLRVGWCGSDLSIRQTLVPLLPLLGRLQRQLGFRFVVMSWPRPALSGDLAWDFVPWSPRAEARLGEHFDLGLMPLRDTPFQAAKCGCKLLQYLACGLPAVATPLGVNADILAGSQAGLAARSDDDWAAAIAHFAAPARRAEAGRRGRAWVAAHYSLERWLPELERRLLGALGLPLPALASTGGAEDTPCIR
jgi:hypothetical protein